MPELAVSYGTKGAEMRTKIAYFCLAAFLCMTILAAGVSEKTSGLRFRFADAAEAAELLLSNRSYYENLNQLDLDYRMQKKGARLEELEALTAKQTRDFTQEEKEILTSAMMQIERHCRERGYTLPVIDEIVFVKTTMKGELDAAAFTHGTQIYLKDDVFTFGRPAIEELMAHELFHCLTRSHPEFRKSMYQILGFTIAEKDFDFGPKVRSFMLSNPDVGHHDTYATFDIHGKMMDCAVVFTSEKPFEKPGDMAFENVLVGLVPITDLSFMYTADEASNFWDVFGRNSNNVIDPEETLADNFSFAVLYGPEGKEYETPEIIYAIDAILRQR